MPPGHPIILLESNLFNMAAVSVKRSIFLHPDFCLDKLVFSEDHMREAYRPTQQIIGKICSSVDPHLEIGEGGGRSSRPLYEEGGAAGLPKKFFSVLLASVWSKNKGGGQALPWICHCALRLSQYLTGLSLRFQVAG